MIVGEQHRRWCRFGCLLWPLLVLPAFLGGPAIGADTTNRLVHESSPYLRLHAHNPVDWFPWGEEAIQKARAEDMPIFLSVGYSTCYWCHVMEREVFSDPAIAELMNRWFVNIKVDREERPELDEIYMTATQLLIRGSGGWPNSVFLTPNLEPFFAGTYFPPEDRLGRPGFPTVLRGLHDAWTNRRAEVESVAHDVAAALRAYLAGGEDASSQIASLEVAHQSVDQVKKRYDESHGGFGTGHKFPSPSNLFLLWEVAERDDAEARRMVLETLRQMGRGAIYDQLDGGFHRYTLDAAWRIPHFEKMLYDNAHLGELLAVTASATADPELERLARGTFEWVLSDMTLENGAFKSAIDAETDTVEGAFYIWTREELAETLDDEGFELLGPIYGFDGEPNFEHDHYTLFLTAPLVDHARRLELSEEDLLKRLKPHLETLRRVRSQRKFPLVDDKVLTDWNGMMIAAMARGGSLLDEPRYIAAAERAAEFVLTLRDGKGTQLHVWRNGVAKIRAFLDDYAYLIRGLIALHEATENNRWLVEAERLSDQLEKRLRDPSGGYFMSQAEPDLLIRVKSAGDGSIPSGNGIAILNFLRLAEITGKRIYRDRAESALKSFSDQLGSYPGSLTTMALAVYRGQDGDSSARQEVSLVVDTVSPTSRMHQLAEEKVQSIVRLTGKADDEGWRPIDVVLDIQEGWHINANPASLEFLIPTQVDGEVRGIKYPPGESFRFTFADQVLSVYSGLTTIPGELAPDEDDVQLTFQPCDDTRCLPPVTRTLSLTE